MTDQASDNPTLADLVRRYCDGELPAEERDALEARAAGDPSVQRLVDNERTLRGWVERSMGDGPVAPVDLERRIRDGLAAGEPERGPVGEPQPEVARRSWLAGPKRVNALAVAACFALVAGAVILGIFGPTIDDLRQRGRTDLVAETVQFVMDEHHRCAAQPSERDAKVRWSDATGAERAMRERLEAPVPVIDLRSLGYGFLGVGDGGLPSSPRSVHLVYAQQAPALDGCPEALVSLFIVPDRGQLDRVLERPRTPSTWSVIVQGDRAHGRVAVMPRDGLLYFLVCCNEGDMEPVAAALGE